LTGPRQLTFAEVIAEIAKAPDRPASMASPVNSFESPPPTGSR
jgi:hypothetical protein